MTKKDLLARIEWLEARVQQLEAKPFQPFAYWSVIPPTTYPNHWNDTNTISPLPPRGRTTC